MQENDRLPRRPLVLSIAVFLAAVLLAPTARSGENPFGPIHVATNRARYEGKGCPIEILYTATLNFAMPHPKGFSFNYHWERSDGAKGPEQVVRPGAGQRSVVLREKWKAGAPGQHFDASVRLFVNSGNTHLSEGSPVVAVTCK